MKNSENGRRRGWVAPSEMSNRISTFRPTGSIGLKCGPVFHAEVVLLMLGCWFRDEWGGAMSVFWVGWYGQNQGFAGISGWGLRSEGYDPFSTFGCLGPYPGSPRSL